MNYQRYSSVHHGKKKFDKEKTRMIDAASNGYLTLVTPVRDRFKDVTSKNQES